MKKYKNFILLSLFTLSLAFPSLTLAENYNDLQITDIIVTPNPLSVDQESLIKIKVKNAGSLTLYSNTGLYKVQHQFSNFIITDTIWPDLHSDNMIKPGGYFYYSFYGKFSTAGQQKLTFKIDTANELLDKNTKDNEFTKTVTIVPANSCDLVVSSVEITPKEPLVREKMQIKIIAKNIGNCAIVKEIGLSNEDTKLSFDGIDNYYPATSTYPTIDNPLSTNKTFAMTFTGTPTRSGEIPLNINLNYLKNLGETNYENNSTSTPITVYTDTAQRDAFDFSDFRYDLVSSSSATFYWKTSKETIGKIGFHKGLYSSDIEYSAGSKKKLSHSITIDDLCANCEYYFRAIGTKDTVTKDTPYIYVKMPANNNLIITDGPDATTNDQTKTAKIKWATNLVSSGDVYYKLKNSATYSKKGTDTSTTTREIELTNLKTGIYDFYTVSKSAVKTYATSTIKSFEIKTIAPATATSTSNVSTTTPATTTQTTVSPQISAKLSPIVIKNLELYQKLKGKIILKVESKGEAYYVSPFKAEMYYLGLPENAFQVVRQLGVGITNANLKKIQTSNATQTAGVDSVFSQKQAGKIFLQVESRGEAWYVNPKDNKKYYMNSPANAFTIMRSLGLGISNGDFSNL